MTPTPAPALADLFPPDQAALAAALGAFDLDSLLRIPPNRYLSPAPLRELKHLEDGESISVIATVEAASQRRMSSRRGDLFTVDIRDDAGTPLTLTFFLFKPGLARWHAGRLTPGTRVLVSGTVSTYRGTKQIAHPDYTIITDDPAADVENSMSIQAALRPTPVYPLRTIPPARAAGRAKPVRKQITQSAARAMFQRAAQLADSLTSPVPASTRALHGLPTFAEAMRMVHLPTCEGDIRSGQHYLRFEEAYVIQSIFARNRAHDAREAAPILADDGPLSQALPERLPFELTSAQITAGNQIAEKIRQPHPTSVLLQGDVGAGKTVVALGAMLRCVDSGHQAALLAPTEVLAQQHARTITALLGDLGRRGQLDAAPIATSVRLLTGSQSTAERRRSLLDIQSGDAGIVIGTHALLTDAVQFQSLGLVVIDEQHRFGVDHRRTLRDKGAHGTSPHVLVMTATPIPRSAALSFVGDLDIVDLPGTTRPRSDLVSYVVHEEDRSWMQRLWQRTAEEVRSGRQAFVVCPRITPKDPAGSSVPGSTHDSQSERSGQPELSGQAEHSVQLHSVEEMAARLAAEPALHGLRIDTLHGQAAAADKHAVMDRFVAGEIDVLIATTVIEVGVDVPNASVMIVMDADRFGLAQLHQLRGRVGRAEHAGIAFFVTQAKKGSESSALLTELTERRDGLALAQLDLERRGAGDLIGTLQSGTNAMRHLDVLRDAELIQQAREDAFINEAMRTNPQLAGTAHPRNASGETASHQQPTEDELQALDSAIARRMRSTEIDVERS